MNVKHGMRNSAEYSSWINMRQRCNNSKHPMYSYYGGRGISICKEWDSFEKFYSDMGPANGLTLDRLDNDKGYSSSNCKWASRQEQSSNRRYCILLTHDGETLNLSEWARKLNIPKGTLYRRYKADWEIKRMFNK